MHEGLTLAIVGRPNVGKSSLFNRLVERERAIVTATPGTTRDLVTETVAIGGIPVHLVDTAGIRDALDEAESIGIRKSLEALADADLVLVITDASQPLTPEDRELIAQASGRNALVIANKSDLVDAREGHDFSRATTAPITNSLEMSSRASAPERTRGSASRGTPTDHRSPTTDFPLLATSALTGDGIPELRAEILKTISGGSPQQETAFLTNLRQQKLVEDSLTALSNALRAVETRTPHEMLLLDLYNALRPLDDITGATTTDDILNLIFSTFCIGK